MTGREFVSLFGSAAATWPLAARAQQPAIPVIGLLSGRLPNRSAREIAAFDRGLSEMGFMDGRNVTIEARWVDNHYDRLPILAADLVRRRVALIAAIAC
jgi:putative tryptophan/tyrosine transport system substrate-binding protein